MSFNTRLSRLRFATRRFSLEFSCSSSFSRFAWSTCSPPYSLRQRKYVCSTIPASLHARAVVLPFAIATSICRNRFTTCSGWYFLPRPICSPCPVLSYPLAHFKPGTPSRRLTFFGPPKFGDTYGRFGNDEQ